MTGQHLDNSINVDNSSFNELQTYYDNILNQDKDTYKTSNDESTPINCVCEMVNKIPEELWNRNNLSILDPCCGNGNFFVVILFKLLVKNNKKTILEDILLFNDINNDRLNNIRKIFCNEKYNLQITNEDFITMEFDDKKYDLVVANPPYAKILKNGKRASKNHNLIKIFVEKSLKLLKPEGYLLFITPDNWMSYADRNTLIKTITSLQVIHLDIHNAKKYFKKIGSSFTWYVIQNCESYKDISISGKWKKNKYECAVLSMKRNYIPLLYNSIVQSILSKTIDNVNIQKFHIETSSFLHRYTKSKYISSTETETFKYKLIHTPKQTVYSSKPHKYQEGYKVFISLTSGYNVFIDNCGMTQSIAFVLCSDEEQAKFYSSILKHPLYVFINNICRWGNFNNVRILQHFPIPKDTENIYEYFNITYNERQFIENNI